MLAPQEKIPFKDLVLYGWMPSFLKKIVYRAKGYKISSSCHLGFGSVVSGRSVEIGDDVHIGMMTMITGRQIQIARRVKIGMMSILNCPVISIGENTRINNKVIVGGMPTPRSAFHIGSNGIVMEWSFINTTEPVVIGNDVGIGGHCLFFTHGMWPNRYEGNPAKFGPIHIHDKVWLAWRVSVLPGATIGNGSIISSDACVTGEIPAGALAGGVPAKVIRSDYSFKSAMDTSSTLKKLHETLEDYEEWLKYNGLSVELDKTTMSMALYASNGSVDARLVVAADEAAIPELSLSKKDCLVCVGGMGSKVRKIVTERGLAWLDIAACERSRRGNDLLADFEEFIRRDGLRLIVEKQ